MPTNFNGFPNGELRFVGIPDLFFTQLLPQISDPIEIKITLHFLWLHARHQRHVISLSDLLSDETLVQSISFFGDDVAQTIEHGLLQSVTRGTLLYTQLEDDAGRHDLYFLNSVRGRQAQVKIESGEMGYVTKTNTELATPLKRANIFELYEDNIGLISPILADELKEAELLYPTEWIEEAFRIAAENNVRRWNYVRAVLEKMTKTGRTGDKPSQANQDDKPWYTEDEFRDILLH
ncbi:DnaD domain protein [Anaerolineales bacterium HSG25]|nr:DnaD domain protein [Anaerolineales bacterium HSG25]